jgi:hypothetical protein
MLAVVGVVTLDLLHLDGWVDLALVVTGETVYLLHQQLALHSQEVVAVDRVVVAEKGPLGDLASLSYVTEQTNFKTGENK